MASDVRERILTAAVDLLKVSGIKKLAQPQVAKAAGVPQGHLTYYFPKKADLLSAVAQRFAELMGNDLSSFAGGRGADGVRAKSLAFAARLVKDRQRTRMLLGLMVEADAEPRLAVTLAQNAEVVRAFVARFVTGREHDDDADLALAALWGLGLQHLVFARKRRDEDTERLVARLGEWLELVAKERPKPAKT